ncbi:MAG: radical SAM protein [Sandaracinaceae bacterium]|nr:radical SAM protein [Sandaracinaceae bacterium]
MSVSAESGSQRVLDEVVGKQLDLADIERAARDAHEAGVPLLVHWMIGLPGERMPEVNRTLERALDLYDRFGAWPAVQFATPLPGTRLARDRAPARRDRLGALLPDAPDAARLGRRTEPGEGALDLRAAPRGLARPREADRERHLRVQQPLHVLRGGHAHAGRRAPAAPARVPRAYRARGVTMVDFDGGEPTLNPELLDLVRHARRIGYARVNVTTNGRRCAYEDYAEALVTSGLTTLLFSVHGPDARTHAQQVGVAEAFDQTIAGIRNCLAHRPEGVELGINVTITKGNHDKLEGIAQLAQELGLAWLNLQFLTPFGRATKWVAPDTAAAARTAMRLIDRFRDRMKIMVINLPFCFMPGYEAHLTGDLAKLSRHMVFVNNETVNLAEYLAERRTRKPVCEECPHACFCGGFYELEDVPEPKWLIAPEDLFAAGPRDLSAWRDLRSAGAADQIGDRRGRLRDDDLPGFPVVRAVAVGSSGQPAQLLDRVGPRVGDRAVPRVDERRDRQHIGPEDVRPAERPHPRHAEDEAERAERRGQRHVERAATRRLEHGDRHAARDRVREDGDRLVRREVVEAGEQRAQPREGGGHRPRVHGLGPVGQLAPPPRPTARPAAGTGP